MADPVNPKPIAFSDRRTTSLSGLVVERDIHSVFSFAKKYCPLPINLPCGASIVIQSERDLPEIDWECPCGKLSYRHWFVRWMKDGKFEARLRG